MGWGLEKERTSLEDTLKTEGLDFSAKYLAACNMHSLAQTNPEVIKPDTISVLEGVLKDSSLSSQRQSLFLYKKVADTLASVTVHSPEKLLIVQAITALKNVLGTRKGHPHRATTEALGSLPLFIQGPRLEEEKIRDIPRVRWQEILEEQDIDRYDAPAFVGRSLVFAVPGEKKSFVIKLARAQDSPETLLREALWMQHLRSNGYSFPSKFHVPTVIRTRQSCVFRLENLPVAVPAGLGLHPARYAAGFIADMDYFTYPNEHRDKKMLTARDFKEILQRNAWLLGKLTSSGIIHTALIELFHNRVQRNRRPDHGVYEWPRGGRLDRWLSSCAYPNFGLTGLRDFEHFISFKGSGPSLYRYIGAHLLSLLLVTGSYFRNKDKARVGFDQGNKPVDARDLFDKQLLKELIRGIFLSYYQGFVGREYTGELPFDAEGLSSRMIEEMGVDRHMEEILRIADQKQMTDEEFKGFLDHRGYSPEEAARLKKGISEIVIYTGPHLGAFNQQISLPELIESVGAMSALCIAGKYWQERFPDID
ncbi:MAG: SidJ-related pseudokinase [Thermodesulfobacteriota bacterium]